MNPEAAPERLYLDYASAMPVRQCALSAMQETSAYGNPGSIHREGVEAMHVLEEARAAVALELAVKPREVIFTSGLTESNNLAILGFARALECEGKSLSETHWITSSIEHDAVLQCFAEIERKGGRVTHVAPNEKGRIEPDVVLRALRPETVLVSIGWANSETGTVQPLRDISRAVKAERPDVLVHADAGQGPLYLSPQVHTLNVDLFSLSSNKIGGPHGIGALYLSNAATLRAVFLGGAQERGLRAGTESVALAAGFATAFTETGMERADAARAVRDVRDSFATMVQQALPTVLVNTDTRHALPHMLNISVPDISSEYVTLALDARGIAVSTKSACREGEFPYSHVVQALGGPEWRATNTLRFSFSPTLTSAALTRAVAALVAIVTAFRQ